jgi:hypothetical protein
MDIRLDPFNVGVGVKVTGTVTYSVEHTFDDVWTAGVTPVAFQNSSMTAQTTNKDGNYAFGVRAIRVNVTAGTGTATMTLVQSGH